MYLSETRSKILIWALQLKKVQFLITRYTSALLEISILKSVFVLSKKYVFEKQPI